MERARAAPIGEGRFSDMLTEVQAGPYSIVGVSVGGVYTSLCVPELGAILDIGIAPRSFVGAPHLFLSHGHADHVGSLVTLLGHRGLAGVDPPRVFLPAEIEEPVREGVRAFTLVQGRGRTLDYVPLEPGQVVPLHADWEVRAFRTLHSVPSLGYEFRRRVQKLRTEFLGLPGPEIRARRLAGEDLFEPAIRREFAYATDTLIDVLDREPELCKARVLVLECTFLDDRKGRWECREKCHIHLDEIIERADQFENEFLVLMHFSQIYRPAEVHEILKRRLPAPLARKLVVFSPDRGPLPG